MPPFPELRDIAPPVEPLDLTAVIVWSVFGAIVGAAAGVALVIWLRARARRAKLPPLPLSATTVATRKLGDLASLAPALSAAELGAQVSDVVRTYLHRARGVLANYRTTDELFQGKNAPRNLPTLPFLRNFEPVLRRCDSLKYGAASTTPDERTALVEQAMAAVHKDASGDSPPMPEVPAADVDAAPTAADDDDSVQEPPAKPQTEPQPTPAVEPSRAPFRTAWEMAQEKGFSSKSPVAIRRPAADKAAAESPN